MSIKLKKVSTFIASRIEEYAKIIDKMELISISYHSEATDEAANTKYILYKCETIDKAIPYIALVTVDGISIFSAPKDLIENLFSDLEDKWLVDYDYAEDKSIKVNMRNEEN